MVTVILGIPGLEGAPAGSLLCCGHEIAVYDTLRLVRPSWLLAALLAALLGYLLPYLLLLTVGSAVASASDGHQLRA